jgi:hypothetical protein
MAAAANGTLQLMQQCAVEVPDRADEWGVALSDRPGNG